MTDYGRRKFLVFLALFTSWLFKPRLSFPSSALPESGSEASDILGKNTIKFKTIDDFLYEELHYDIGFLWFRRAATGTLSFSRSGDGYRAEMQAETRGFIGFFTSYRRHAYISYLDYLPEEKKLRSRRFDRQVIIGKKKDSTITELDYEKKLMSWTRYKMDKPVKSDAESIPEGIEYEDIMSAFYNFSLGCYGPIERGRSFQVRTIPDKGESTIYVRIPDLDDMIQEKKLFGKGFNRDLIQIKVKVPKKIFKSKSGEVSWWIDDDLKPLKGVVKDYIGFGDITGILQRG